LITRLKPFERTGPPAAGLSEIQTESDVEQKILYPFLVHPSFVGIPHEWVRTKEYMEPTDIDKSAGKRYGYIPDYSIWRNGFPLLIVEAKPPDDPIEKALRAGSALRKPDQQPVSAEYQPDLLRPGLQRRPVRPRRLG
jgi:hypothetical protein